MDNIKMPVAPILDGNSFVVDGDVISTTGSGGFPPNTNKGLDVEDNKLVVKADDETIKFDSDGSIISTNLRFVEYPSESLVNLKCQLPSSSCAKVIKINDAYYTVDASGFYKSTNEGLTWVKDTNIVGQPDNIYYDVIDGQDYIFLLNSTAHYSGYPVFSTAVIQVNDSGYTRLGYVNYSHKNPDWPVGISIGYKNKHAWFATKNSSSWGTTGNIEISCVTIDFTKLVSSPIDTSNAATRSTMSLLSTSASPVEVRNVPAGQWACSHNNTGYIYVYREDSASSSYKRLSIVYNGTPYSYGITYCNGYYYCFSIQTSETKFLKIKEDNGAQSVCSLPVASAMTNSFRAAYNDQRNIWVSFSNGQLWKYDTVEDTWEKLSEGNQYRTIDVFNGDGEMYGIKNNATDVYALGTTTKYKIEQDGDDISSELIRWIRFNVGTNL